MQPSLYLSSALFIVRRRTRNGLAQHSPSGKRRSFPTFSAVFPARHEVRPAPRGPVNLSEYGDDTDAVHTQCDIPKAAINPPSVYLLQVPTLPHHRRCLTFLMNRVSAPRSAVTSPGARIYFTRYRVRGQHLLAESLPVGHGFLEPVKSTAIKEPPSFPMVGRLAGPRDIGLFASV